MVVDASRFICAFGDVISAWPPRALVADLCFARAPFLPNPFGHWGDVCYWCGNVLRAAHCIRREPRDFGLCAQCWDEASEQIPTNWLVRPRFPSEYGRIQEFMRCELGFGELLVGYLPQCLADRCDP